MKLMVSSYNNGGSAYNAEAEETSLLHYKINHRFNEPAECWLILADPTGSIAQKYNVDANDVYIGAGKVTLEDPTGTDIFFGRIMKATADTKTRTVELYCLDWLSQLDEELVTYDMREDLDGSGLRESVVYPDYDDTDANGINPAYNAGGGTYYVYDHEMSWANDAFNGMNMILSDKMAGNITVTTGPYTHTSDASTSDTFTHDIGDLWTVDSDCHTALDVGGPFYTEFNFKVWVPDSDFHVSTSLTGAYITIVYKGGTTSAVTQLYNGATYDDLQDSQTGNSGATIEKRIIDITDDLVSGSLDANGEVIVRLDEQFAGGGGFTVYYIAVTYSFTTTGYSTPVTISDTVNGNRLTIGTDLSADATRVWHGLPYSIGRPIYKHIDSAETPGDIITDGDGMETLTCAATIEHTSGISTRQFQNMTRLEILRDLAVQDAAEFWIGLGATTVNWKSTWNDGVADQTLSDTDVNTWTSTFDYQPVVNNALVYGMRVGDRELSYEYTNTTSTAKYNAIRSKIVKDTGIVSEYDCKARATATGTQYADPLQILTASIRGNTATAAHPKTTVLGDEVQVTSTYLGLTNAWYIVQGYSYDTTTHLTTLKLHPRVSQTGLQQETFTPQKIAKYRKGDPQPYIASPASDIV